MDYRALLFAISGIPMGILINYLADVLPGEPYSPHPVCSNPECREPYPWINYFLLRKCHKCGTLRRPRTWILLVIVIFSAGYLWLVPPKGIGVFGGLAVLAYLLLVAIIDLETHLILRSLSIAGLFVCTGAGILIVGWKAAMIGGVAGFVIIFIIYLLGKLYSRLRFKKTGSISDEEAFASGDVTLALLLGLLVGWPLIWLNLLIGILISGIVGVFVLAGTIVSRHSGKQGLMTFIPLGPGFIIASILIIYFPSLLSLVVPK